MNIIQNNLIKGIDRLASTNFTERLRQLHVNNPDKFLVTSAIISVVAKDAIGCYYYTTQSLNNERIPEDKRKFVASLDLVNGVLMILSQLTLGLLVDTKTESWFNKYVKKYFNEENSKKLFNKLRQENPALTEEAFKKALANVEKFSKTGFKLLVPLVASTIVAKRMLVPLIATPLAGKFKDKYMDKKTPEPDTKGIVPINDCFSKQLETSHEEENG